jgi:DNA/RNA endonuclease G (NUC1)
MEKHLLQCEDSDPSPPLHALPSLQHHLLHRTLFLTQYHKDPLSVHELITKEIADGDAPRAKYFYPSDHIKERHFQVDGNYFYETKAYKLFNINRGHMAAAGNYSGN